MFPLSYTHGRAEDDVIDAILAAGFTATTDYPACLIYKRLTARFPKALVLLGVRSSGTAWADSIMATIGRVGTLPADRNPAAIAPLHHALQYNF